MVKGTSRSLRGDHCLLGCHQPTPVPSQCQCSRIAVPHAICRRFSTSRCSCLGSQLFVTPFACACLQLLCQTVGFGVHSKRNSRSLRSGTPTWCGSSNIEGFSGPARAGLAGPGPPQNSSVANRPSGHDGLVESGPRHLMWMVCKVASELIVLRVTFCGTSRMCGMYRQCFWSRWRPVGRQCCDEIEQMKTDVVSASWIPFQ